MLNLSNRAEIGTEIAARGGSDAFIFSIMGILRHECFPSSQIFFGCNYSLSDTRVSGMTRPGCRASLYCNKSKTLL